MIADDRTIKPVSRVEAKRVDRWNALVHLPPAERAKPGVQRELDRLFQRDRH